MVQVKTKRLGQILIDSGTITPDQLDMALKEQSQTREKLGFIFQRLGICSEKEISLVLAKQAGVDCIDLASLDITREVADLVPRELAEQRSVLPLRCKGSSLHVAMANPLDLATIDELGRITGKYVEVFHAPESEIQDSIVRFYGVDTVGSLDISKLIESSQQAVASGVKLNEDDSPFVKLVHLLIRLGVEDGATDIHIEPEEKILRCRYRIDGQLVQGAILPRELLGIVITRVKILAEMNISENRVPQDGRIVFNTGKRTVDLRVSTFPTIHGEAVVCRVLDKEALIVGLERLGMSDLMGQAFRSDITKPHGIILVTGPTGSGKTTTLYSALTFLNKPDTKIITLEDPVEYELPLINQAQINNAKGFTFAKGLRAILRQDPDILLVGEIRDVETAQLAIRAALTGHLVFSTLHTNSAAGAIPRLLDMGIEPFLLSATLISVLAQRLVRTNCPSCTEFYQPSPDDLARLGMSTEQLPPEGLKIGKGCPMCRNSGTRGRQAVFEYLQITSQLRELVAAGSNAETIARVASKNGGLMLIDDAKDKLLSGSTCIKEVIKVSV